jgi:hypothetical protein
MPLWAHFVNASLQVLGSIPDVQIYRFCSAGWKPASGTNREQDAPTTNYFYKIGMLPKN